MVDRVDLLIAVIGIVVSVVGSSTALWMAVSKKADKEDVARLESRVAADVARLESRVAADLARVEAKVTADIARVEGKLDGLIMRLVPDRLSDPGA